MGRLISITSGKGGTGKTTTTANLAIALGKHGYKVCAIDADLTMANLSLIMGLDNVNITIHDVLAGEAKIDDAIYTTEYENVHVIPAAVDWEHVIKADPRNLPSIIKPLKSRFDFILIDCPAGLQMDAMSAMLSGEEAVIVTNPEISCITDSMKVGIVLKKAGLAILGFVLNRYGRSENDIPPEAAEEVMEIPLLAVIPEDPAIREATLEGVPVVAYKPKSEGAKAFMELAEKITRIAGYKARVMY
ncbi:cell division ATPase MinD [Thermococcus sp. SY098]|uniref:Septum site-determining MinD-like protein n=1 Tax=Thermococcus barophilus (strain DSM 11836 / MP) TaxID=391623 RepID=F0LMR1_THEBM|nr:MULTISPECIES: cell division ATPase MinD [Thermococcus]ADT84040.1 septum site-determining MinD-like protein [Thermococcus barophilus MP]WRS53192.1 cell division ATPase MinD [Thermococcus sp. SY098]